VKAIKESREDSRLLADVLFRAGHAADDDDATAAKNLAAMVPHLRALATGLERGHRAVVPLDADLVADLTQPDEALTGRWQALARLARRLEALAHKQLRGVPFSAAERVFLQRYGETLSEVMGYPSIYGAVDDAPRVASVHWSQGVSGGPREYQLVATGHPTAMFILYPWERREVLCEGVVVPYHEFACPERLTDAQWRARLDDDAGRAPTVPEWVRRLYNEDPKPNPER
jgi:hypothetical protein